MERVTQTPNTAALVQLVVFSEQGVEIDVRANPVLRNSKIQSRNGKVQSREAINNGSVDVQFLGDKVTVTPPVTECKYINNISGQPYAFSEYPNRSAYTVIPPAGYTSGPNVFKDKSVANIYKVADYTGVIKNI